jgi:hypothetical protein
MRRLLWLLPLVLAACGEAGEPVAVPSPEQPVQSRAEHPREPAARPPTSCRRVSRRLVGRQLPAAERIAAKARCPLRVVIQDGKSLPVTEDFSPDRINVRVDRGEVTEVLGLF